MVKSHSKSLITLACVLGISVNASDPIDMTVKPELCITTKRAPTCFMDIQIEWRSSTADDYCLHCSLVDGPLACWDNATLGTHTDPRTVEADFTYAMTEEGASGELGVVEVKVLAAESSDRRRNRRKRHVWSVW